MKMTQSEVFTYLNNTLNYLLTHHVETFTMAVQHYMFAGIWFNQIAYF